MDRLTIRSWMLPLAALLGALALLSLSPVPAAAQVTGFPPLGAASVLHQILRLGTTASVLVIGAHPDDEDSLFMAEASWGEHARVAYLSLTRGEGGQNAIGPELFDLLGVIRTEELLQARTLDGGEQLFGREFDFGFSKTAEESSRMWGEQEVLADIVRAIRMFRPLVVYSVWSGTPADGHGHHQLSGKLARVAFHAAGDPARYPEQIAEGLQPWQASKFYQFRGYGPSGRPGTTTRVQGGTLDPLLGLTYVQIAARGRSQHKSQAMGTPEINGPFVSNLALVDPAPSPGSSEKSVFDGIDTSISGIPALAGLSWDAVRPQLQEIQATVSDASAAFDPLAPGRSVPALAKILLSIRNVREALRGLQAPAGAKAEADFLLDIKEHDAALALQEAAGVTVESRADTETVTAGESFLATVNVFLAHPEGTKVADVSLVVPDGWAAAAVPVPRPSGQTIPEVADRSDAFRVSVAKEAPPTQPYWLRSARQGDLFVWPPGSAKAEPFDPPLVTAVVRCRIAGESVTLHQPLRFHVVDRVRGDLLRNVEVVPAITLSFRSGLDVVPLEARGAGRPATVVLQNNSKQTTAGSLRLELPAGWRCLPGSSPFSLKPGEQTSTTLQVIPAVSATPGRYDLRAVATSESRRYDQSLQTVAYAHIQTHRVYVPAQKSILVLDLKVAPVRVGYIMGTGDRVPEAMRLMGLPVTMLDEGALAGADLSGLDTIVVGVSASAVRPDFVAALPRLYRWVSDGGVLIVQYQHPDFTLRNLPPFPAQMASRVTDETAEVNILVPSHPAFTTPNRITEQDFAGWVQERNLFAFSTFDPRYTPLLESHDPGEAPQSGGEVEAILGKGRFVYTAYDWFRELPAGVPGAYRLFANLVSLGAWKK